MRRIELTKITLERFRSFRKRTEIELSPTSGLKLITGKNEKEPKLGANGVGKSTLWDAVCFCLWNASVKGLRPSDLVSWKADGPSQAYACTEWLIDGEEVKVERTSNPDRLLLNGQRVEQAAIGQLFNISAYRFAHAVIFGQSMPLFVDLSIPKRADLLDEVLDLGIWLEYSERAGRMADKLARDREANRREVSRLEGILEGIGDLSALQAKADGYEAERGERIDGLIARVAEQEEAVQQRQRTADEIAAELRSLPAQRAGREVISKLWERKSSIAAELSTAKRDQVDAQKLMQFYDHAQECPTCGQAIDAEFATQQIEELSTKLGTTQQALTALAKVEARLAEEIETRERAQNALLTQYAGLEKRQTEADLLLKQAQRTMTDLEVLIESAASSANVYQAQLDQAKQTHSDTSAAIIKLNGDHRLIEAREQKALYWKGAFKRVRLFLVKRILDQLEIETMASIRALGLHDWQIKFDIENVNKSGTAKPGIFVTVHSPEASATWEAWSGGEAQRIRLAVTMGMASLIQRMSGISMGFEVWDEPSSWLSPEGIEDLLRCLRDRALRSGKSLWFCDHRALIYSGFDEIWEVAKDAHGSRVNLISASEG